MALVDRPALRRYLDAVRTAARRAALDDLSTLAAGIAYRIFLSIFPGAIAAVAVARVVVSPSQLFESANRLPLLPEAARGLLRDSVLRTGETAAGGIAVVAVALGLFTATSAAATLIRSLNRINGVPPRSLPRQRAVALLLTVALFAGIAGLLGLLVLGPQLQDRLLAAMPVGSAEVAPLLRAARVLAAVALLIVLFAFVYWRAPNQPRARWRWMSPGAATGVLGWLALSGLFNLYVQNFADYGVAYGTLSGVAVVLVWLQLSMFVLLFGAEVDVQLALGDAQPGAVNGARAPGARAWSRPDPSSSRPA